MRIPEHLRMLLASIILFWLDISSSYVLRQKPDVDSMDSADHNVISSRNSRRTDHDRSRHRPQTATTSWDRSTLLSAMFTKSYHESARTVRNSGRSRDDHVKRKKRSRQIYYGWEVGRRKHEDIPLIQCPANEEHMDLYPCPTPLRTASGASHYVCIDERMLCDRRYDCPGREDEDPTICMFHKLTLNLLSTVGAAVFQLSRTLF